MGHGDASSAQDGWPEVEYRSLADGGMLYHAATGRIHHLNLTAARVWEAHSKGMPETSIAEQLCREFDVEYPRALGDVQRILAEFAMMGLPDP